MKRRVLLSVSLITCLLLWPAPAMAAPSEWDARIFQDANGSFVGQTVIRTLSNSKLKVVAPFIRQVGNNKYLTVHFWRGTCSNRGEELIASSKKKSTPYGYIEFTMILNKKQSRIISGALSVASVAISLDGNCGEFRRPESTGMIRSNPTLFGNPGRYEEWEMTIVSINDDAYPELLDANMFNDPPHPGWQYVLFNARVKYLGDQSSSTRWFNSRVRAVGASGRTYQNSLSYSCGVFPEPDITVLGSGIEMFPGSTIEGNLFCLEVQSSDLASLVVYFGADNLPYDQRTWWAIR